MRILAAFWLLLSGLALANDGSAEATPVGGIRLKREARISMEKERLTIGPRPGDCRIRIPQHHESGHYRRRPHSPFPDSAGLSAQPQHSRRPVRLARLGRRQGVEVPNGDKGHRGAGIGLARASRWCGSGPAPSPFVRRR